VRNVLWKTGMRGKEIGEKGNPEENGKKEVNRPDTYHL
jgi:hypothetical protein